jgi:hypothetical protein
MKKIFIIVVVCFTFLTLNCEREEYFCWECIQTQISLVPVDFSFGDKHIQICGQTEEGIKEYEILYTGDKYFYLNGVAIPTHFETKCFKLNNK